MGTKKSRLYSATGISARLAVLLIYCAGIETGSAWAQASKKVALLVGVNKYDKRGFRDLDYAERDVIELADVLGKSDYDVHLLLGSKDDARRATLANIKVATNSVLKGLTKSDLVLVGLAGHGLQIDVAGAGGRLQAESFYCPVDAEKGNPETMLSAGKLFDEIDRRGGGFNLVLIDACREDPTRGRGLDGSKVQGLPEGVAVLFGCRSGQKTYESAKAGGGHGLFFNSVLDGLRGGAKNDRGEITWSRLTDYVVDHVEADGPTIMQDRDLVQTPNLVANLPGRSPVLARIERAIPTNTPPAPDPKTPKVKPGETTNDGANSAGSNNGKSGGSITYSGGTKQGDPGKAKKLEPQVNEQVRKLDEQLSALEDEQGKLRKEIRYQKLAADERNKLNQQLATATANQAYLLKGVDRKQLERDINEESNKLANVGVRGKTTYTMKSEEQRFLEENLPKKQKLLKDIDATAKQIDDLKDKIGGIPASSGSTERISSLQADLDKSLQELRKVSEQRKKALEAANQSSETQSLQ